MTLTLPKYSFVQFQSATAECCPDPAFCLPLSSTANLQFYAYLSDVDLSGAPDATRILCFAYAVPTDYTQPSATVLGAYNPYAGSSATNPVPLLFANHYNPGTTASGTMTLHYDYAWGSYDSLVAVGDCFKLMLTCMPANVGSGVSAYPMQFMGFTNCFQRTDSASCYTSVITYSNNSDAFDVQYLWGKPSMIELPIYLRDPVLQNEQKVYTQSDGTIVKLYERKEEVYTLETDLMPYAWHKSLDIALSNDNVTIVNANATAFDPLNTATQFVKKENYDIEYQKAPLSALGKGTCKLSNATPIHLVNNNCA